MYPLKLTFYLCLIASVFMFIFSVVTGTLTIGITPLGWLLTSVLSIVVALGAVSLFQVGINIIGSQSTAILSTFEPITSVIIGVLAFDEEFNIRILMGCIFILLSAILLAVSDTGNKTHDKLMPLAKYPDLKGE